MNKIVKYSFLLLASCFLFLSSCDYIANPLLPKSGGTINASTSVSAFDSTGSLKNVMVEDYTGEWCENCPFAAYQLDTIIRNHALGRIVPLSINTGYYATPSTLPSPYKNFNYTSGVGDIYASISYFNVQAVSAGFINRQGALAASPNTYPQWAGLVANSIVNDTCFIKLKLSTQFDTVARNLSVTATTTFIKALVGTYNLVILLTEDSMIGPQNIGGTLNLTYPHRFVLHDVINSAFGDSLNNHSAPNQSLTKTYNYNISKYYPTSTSQVSGANTPTLTCNYKQCNVVAYIYKANANTTQYPAQYVVLQSLALKIYQK